jgi:hypothetical protein
MYPGNKTNYHQRNAGDERDLGKYIIFLHTHIIKNAPFRSDF